MILTTNSDAPPNAGSPTVCCADASAPDALEALRRKLGFRAWHRGTREADLLIGSFADRHLAEFDSEALLQFERLLTENDPDIYEWMTAQKPVPAEHENKVTLLLRQFRMTAKAP